MAQEVRLQIEKWSWFVGRAGEMKKVVDRIRYVGQPPVWYCTGGKKKCRATTYPEKACCHIRAAEKAYNEAQSPVSK